MLGGVSYLEISERGLKIAREGVEEWLEVDTIVVCAGQESLRDLVPETAARTTGRSNGSDGANGGNGPRYHVIGGAKVATELDAKRAIREGAEVAAAL